MKYAIIYGGLSGAVVAGVITAGLVLGPENGIFNSLWFGYLVMFVALSFVFMGVKRYRDVEKGGVIRFLPALGIGVAIAVVAAIAYNLVWEIYLAATDYAFIEQYAASYARSQAAAGVPAATIAADVQWMRDVYASPIQRMAITVMEIFPVGLIMALFSAAVLRNPRVLPARAD